MNTSQASSSNAPNGRRQLPVCPCRSTMRFYISGSSKNPGRPYWKCRYYDSNYSCKLFVWDEDLTEEHFTMRDSRSMETTGGVFSENQSCKGCDYAEKVLEASSKEKEKLKIKLAKERERVKGLTSRFQRVQFVLILSWVLFAVYVGWFNGN